MQHLLRRAQRTEAHLISKLSRKTCKAPVRVLDSSFSPFLGPPGGMVLPGGCRERPTRQPSQPPTLVPDSPSHPGPNPIRQPSRQADRGTLVACQPVRLGRGARPRCKAALTPPGGDLFREVRRRPPAEAPDRRGRGQLPRRRWVQMGSRTGSRPRVGSPVRFVSHLSQIPCARPENYGWTARTVPMVAVCNHCAFDVSCRRSGSEKSCQARILFVSISVSVPLCLRVSLSLCLSLSLSLPAYPSRNYSGISQSANAGSRTGKTGGRPATPRLAAWRAGGLAGRRSEEVARGSEQARGRVGRHASGQARRRLGGEQAETSQSPPHPFCIRTVASRATEELIHTCVHQSPCRIVTWTYYCTLSPCRYAMICNVNRYPRLC